MRSGVGMFDSHVHFDAVPFWSELDRTAAAARAAGVVGAVNPAVDLESSRKALAVHQRHGWVLPAVGFHPLWVGEGADDDVPVAELTALAATGEFVAVGEVGLDFWAGRKNEARQRAFLAAQAALASRFGLPILLHTRRSFYEAFAALKDAGFEGPGVAHAFSGSREMARLALDRGFCLSASSVLTRPAADRIRDVFRWAPSNRILVETDAPDLPPWSKRGQLHRPEDLLLTVEALARTRGLSVADTAQFTTENARQLFRTEQGGPERGGERR